MSETYFSVLDFEKLSTATLRSGWKAIHLGRGLWNRVRSREKIDGHTFSWELDIKCKRGTAFETTLQQLNFVSQKIRIWGIGSRGFARAGKRHSAFDFIGPITMEACQNSCQSGTGNGR